ncbi:potassium transporter TrkG [Entomospira entomophila]|uniref:Potassium transporter n=1 Tax=Entomospira entomophila TaxID=2719988 RepID=A0A968GBA1_9SPIO|nr:potassium transporter TrkG [Entomospira entomophilus]NIZ40463.1 hypothetical protein [Entomospira entomophilus]WDI36021.1 potassium transporter TrkG [Entomospira entomophilus]
MGIATRTTETLRRVNLFLMLFSILFIFLSSSHVYYWGMTQLWHSIVIPRIIMGVMIVDMIYQIVKERFNLAIWLRRSLFLLIWTCITIIYGAVRLSPSVSVIGYQKSFYAMVLLRSILFYFGQMNQQQLRRYVSMLLQKPAHITVMSYLVLMVMIAVLLLLPISQLGSADGHGLSMMNAIFLSVSAFCVTGLSPIDISQTLSPIGLTILLIAVQLGGIGIALLGSIMLYVRRSVGLSGRTLLAYSFSDEAVSDVGRVALRVILITIVIELLGAGYFFFYFLKQGFSLLSALGHGIFFSVSAFCNAGFSLFQNGMLEEVRFDFSFLWMISLLVTLGVLGFHYMFYGTQRIKNHFYRMIHQVRHHVHRREHNSAMNETLVIWSGNALLLMIIIFFFAFYAFEHRHSLFGFSLIEQYTEIFFLAVESKTAGFMSRDLTTLRLSTQLLIVVGMFIGGSSGGTAGGIKMSTILVIFAGMRAFVTQQPLAKIGTFSISWDDVRRANLLFISGILLIVMATIVMSITEKNQDPFFMFWEVTSALGTVGTSMNYTSSLSVLGKMVIMSVMIIGRMGALTLFNVAQERTFKKEPSYPLGNIYIG